MQVGIRFTKYGCCTAVSSFEPGDIARVSTGMAKHLVDEAQVAKYLEAPAPADAIGSDGPELIAPKPRKRKGK